MKAYYVFENFSEEARKMVVSNPYSFLHIDKAEIDLDSSIDFLYPSFFLKSEYKYFMFKFFCKESLNNQLIGIGGSE